MNTRTAIAAWAALSGCTLLAWRQNPNQPPAARDAVVDAQQPSAIQNERPEQQKTAHDNSNVFDPQNAKPSSAVFQAQPAQGKNSGFGTL
jgi:hypothetical protein